MNVECASAHFGRKEAGLTSNNQDALLALMPWFKLLVCPLGNFILAV